MLNLIIKGVTYLRKRESYMQIKTKKICVPIKPVQSNVSFMSKSVKKDLSINFDEFINESKKLS